ncbi:MAG TPA: hypothetical protein PLC05_02640 [bacterium]|nr:hypothetical protein [bacterium]HPL56377.1 hypothetical protein [bacterium]
MEMGKIIEDLESLYAQREYGELDELLGQHAGPILDHVAWGGQLRPEIILAAKAAWAWNRLSLFIGDSWGGKTPLLGITPGGKGFVALGDAWYSHVAGRRCRRFGRKTAQGGQISWAYFSRSILAQFAPGDVVAITSDPTTSKYIGSDGHGHKWYARLTGRMW